MSEVVALNVSPTDDLNNFSQYLWQQGVSHRVTMSEGRQLLLVGNQEIARQVNSAYAAMLENPSETPQLKLPETAEPKVVLKTLWRHLPITICFIVLSLVGFAIVYFNQNLGWARYLTFFDFQQSEGSLIFSIVEGQYWRLITPVFLHFGILHIAFNMAMFWFLGQRIEVLQGSLRLLSLVLLISLGSNIIQAAFSGAAIFGGMSGVVYGLLGYGWIWSALKPDQPLHIPPALVYFSLFMLVMGFLGVVDMLGAGRVANAAHLGGLIVGCILGAGAGVFSKSDKD